MALKKLAKVEEVPKKIEEDASSKFFKKVLFETDSAEKTVEDVFQVFFEKNVFIEFRIPKLNWEKIIRTGTQEFAKRHLKLDLSKHPKKHAFIIKWFRRKRNLLLWAKLKLIAKIKLLRILFSGKEPKITVVSKKKGKHVKKQTKEEKKEDDAKAGGK